MAHNHDAAFVWVIEAPDNNRMEFFDCSLQLFRELDIGDVVWVIDSNDIATETRDAAVKRGCVQFATGRGCKII